MFYLFKTSGYEAAKLASADDKKKELANSGLIVKVFLRIMPATFDGDYRRLLLSVS